MADVLQHVGHDVAQRIGLHRAQVDVRDRVVILRIEAERPKILSPEYFCRMMLEGFGERAQEYVDRLREQARQIAVLRYGFQFRKSGVMEETVNASLQSVIDRTRHAVENAGDTNGAIIQGVDEAWEVCLLKFTIEMIERSAGENIGDFKRRGLI